MRYLSIAAALGVLAGTLVLGDRPATADDKEKWGNIKGQIVWPGDVPPPLELKVDKDEKVCQAQGKLTDETYVIDKDSKGLRWVYVWLTPVEAGKELPIHPDLKEIKDKEVVIDQPCCKFEPHSLAMRQGQTLVAKNSSTIAHNMKYDGRKDSGNPLIPAKQEVKLDLKADDRPIAVSCSIHGWMRGWVRVFDHPYFAVTDKDGKFEIKNAPAGEYRLKIWHDSGWLNGAKGKDGQKITITGGKDNDLGKMEWKSE